MIEVENEAIEIIRALSCLMLDQVFPDFIQLTKLHELDSQQNFEAKLS